MNGMVIQVKCFLEVFISALAILFAGVLVGTAFLCSCRVAARCSARLAKKGALLSVLLGAMVIVGVFTGFSKTNGANRACVPMHVARRLLVEDSDVARISEITTQSAGVGVVLHRPSSRANIAEEVVLCGSTNLVTETWEAVANIQFPLGVTDVPCSVSRATLDIHGAGSAFFLAFASAGDSDGDGLMDWDEWLNFKTESDDPYSAIASLQERLSTAIPYPHAYPDGLAVKFGGHSPNEFLDDGFTVFEHVFYTGRWNGAMDYSPVAGEGDCLLMVAIDCPAVDEWATLVVGNQRFPLRPGWTETVQLAVPAGEWFDVRIEKGEGWNLASVQPSASILDSDAFLVGAPSSDAAGAEPVRYYAIPLQGRTVCLHGLTATEHRYSFAAPGLEGLAAAVQVVNPTDDLTFTAIDGEDAACTVHAAFPVWERRRIRVFFSHADLFVGPQSAEMDVHFCGRGTSEGCSCCDDNVQSSSCACTEGMSAFDVDGDGLANEVDPEPYVAGPDAHGTNAEWYKIVCSNVFVTCGLDSTNCNPIWLPSGEQVGFKSEINTNAYYFVDVIAEQGPSAIYFTADRESLLGSPMVIARTGETNRVPLLIGIDYEITSSVPISATVPDSPHVVVTPKGSNCLSVKWPLDFVLTEAYEGMNRVYTVNAEPFNPGGVFAWGLNARQREEPHQWSDARATCGCVTYADNRITFGCSASCDCQGNCGAYGTFSVEGALFSVEGGVCRCGFDDPEPSRVHYVGPPESSYLSVSFSRPTIIFEEAYQNQSEPLLEPKRSTRVRLDIVAYGGAHGGQLAFSSTNLAKIDVVGDSLSDLLSHRTIGAGEMFATSYVCEGRAASSVENDVCLTATFSDNVTGSTLSSTSALSVVRAEIRPRKPAPKNSCINRHDLGVFELVDCFHAPLSIPVQWRLEGGGNDELAIDGYVSNSTDTPGADALFRCPLTNNWAALEMSIGNTVYRPKMTYLEPTSVRADAVDYRFGREVRSPNQPGAIALRLQLYVYPMIANFEEIALVEVPWRQGGCAEGYYAESAQAIDRYHDVLQGAGVWHNVKTNNYWATDLAGTNPITNNWSAGRRIWEIPIGWNAKNQVLGANAIKIIETVQMQFVIDANGTVRVDKFGNWASRGMSAFPEGPDDGPVMLNGESKDFLTDSLDWLEKDSGVMWL